MPRILPWSCGAIGVAALAAGGWATAEPALDYTPMSPATLNRLQHLATASCQCERHAGPAGKQKCWADFERQMPGSDSDSLCEPEVHIRCAGDEMFGPDCVTMDYHVAGYQLCSSDEVDVMEAMLDAELTATHGKDPIPKTERLYRDIVAGKPLPDLTGGKGCGG